MLLVNATLNPEWSGTEPFRLGISSSTSKVKEVALPEPSRVTLDNLSQERRLLAGWGRLLFRIDGLRDDLAAGVDDGIDLDKSIGL